MNDITDKDIRDMRDGLTRQEERGLNRDAVLADLRTMITALNTKVDVLAGDMRDAKTGLRLGFWLLGLLGPPFALAMGWLAHHLWPLGK